MTSRRATAGGPPHIRQAGARRAGTGQAGSATAELALIANVLLMLLLLVVAGGRVASGQQRVDAAARDAARAASIERDPAAAAQAAQATATASLAGEQFTCTDFQVATDASAFTPGGSVTVAVACTVPLGDLTLLALPGSRTMQARFAHPIDVFRGVLP